MIHMYKREVAWTDNLSILELPFFCTIQQQMYSHKTAQQGLLWSKCKEICEHAQDCLGKGFHKRSYSI